MSSLNIFTFSKEMSPWVFFWCWLRCWGVVNDFPNAPRIALESLAIQAAMGLKFLISIWYHTHFNNFHKKQNFPSLPVKGLHVYNSIPGMMTRLTTQLQWGVKTTFHLGASSIQASKNPNEDENQGCSKAHLPRGKTLNPVLPRRWWATSRKALQVVGTLHCAGIG